MVCSNKEASRYAGILNVIYVPMMFDDEMLDADEELDENGLPLLDEEEEVAEDEEEVEDDNLL